MKVRCIDNKDNCRLTINKIYDLLRKEELEIYWIINDKNDEDWFCKSRFEGIYSIEEIKNGKFAIEVDNENDWKKLKDNELNDCSRYWTNSNFYSIIGHAGLGYYQRGNYTIIKFNQIEFIEEFILPEKWSIQITDKNVKYLNDYLKNNKHKYPSYVITWKISNTSNSKLFYSEQPIHIHCHSSYEIYKGFTEITFEQFKKYILKEKKILGYKLIKPEFEIACNFMLGCLKEYKGISLQGVDDAYGINQLKEAGVLDLWFEKVYEEEFKIDDWVTVHTLPEKNHWLLDTNKRTFKIVENINNNLLNGYAVNYLNNYGIDKKYLRLATEEEIKATNIIIIPMTASNGDFEIEVSRDKIFYRLDNKELTKSFIEEIINSFVDIQKVRSLHPYSITTDTITVGCKSNTTLKSWKKVLDTYNSFK